MCSGERPMGAANDKQTSTMALCQPPPHPPTHMCHAPDLPLASAGLRHDQTGQGPTEPHAGRSTFLLSSGGAGGRVLLSGLWYGADHY